ncbi:MAG: T9SS type A sorting domain-containing protein [Bacteroidetes bacterium]|nr:MAG: T9SS type A sorting domain-containing protein [Bacteroidota bacterium]
MKAYKGLLFLIVFIIANNHKANSQHSFINQYIDIASVGLKAYSCTEGKDSNYLLAAFGYNPANLDSNLLILKLKRNGDTLWTKYYDLSVSLEIPRHIIATDDSGFVVSGDNFIMKADRNGNVDWLKLINGKSVKWIEPIPEGYIFCLTAIQGSIGDNFILKTDPLGNLISFHELTAGLQNWLYRISRLRNGDYAISAAIYSHAFAIAHVLFTDSNLNVKATLSIEGEFVQCIETSDKDLVVAYSSSQGTNVLRMDTTGNIKWIKYLNPYCAPSSIDTLADGGIIICGSDNLYPVPSEFYISKFDSTGNLFQTDIFCCFDELPLVKTTSDGGYITFLNDSVTDGTINFIKDSPVGYSRCLQSDSGSTTASNQMPQYFVFALSWFTVSPLQLVNDTASIYSGCVRSQLCTTTDIQNEWVKSDYFQAVPNPLMNSFSLLFKSVLNESLKVEIYDQVGRIVYEEYHNKFAENFLSLNLSVPSGFYFVNVISGNNFSSKKIVVIRN